MMPSIECDKVAIVTTVSNFSLYAVTSATFPAGLRRYVIDGTNGMHALDSIVYAMRKLRGSPIEWIVMVDEDVVFINSDKVLEIINVMADHGYCFSGVRDGGVIPHRTMNPYVVNTFFSVINFRDILSMWDRAEVLRQQYTAEQEFDDDLSSLNKGYDANSLYEPYYCFYLWLRRRGRKGLFLNSIQPIDDDNLTSAVLTPDGEVFLYHTWHARSYGRNEEHTSRIDRVLGLGNPRPQALDVTIYRDRTYALRKAASKVVIRFKYRLRRLITSFAA